MRMTSTTAILHRCLHAYVCSSLLSVARLASMQRSQLTTRSACGLLFSGVPSTTRPTTSSINCDGFHYLHTHTHTQHTHTLWSTILFPMFLFIDLNIFASLIRMLLRSLCRWTQFFTRQVLIALHKKSLHLFGHCKFVHPIAELFHRFIKGLITVVYHFMSVRILDWSLLFRDAIILWLCAQSNDAW